MSDDPPTIPPEALAEAKQPAHWVETVFAEHKQRIADRVQEIFGEPPARGPLLNSLLTTNQYPSMESVRAQIKDLVQKHAEKHRMNPNDVVVEFNSYHDENGILRLRAAMSREENHER